MKEQGFYLQRTRHDSERMRTVVCTVQGRFVFVQHRHLKKKTGKIVIALVIFFFSF